MSQQPLATILCVDDDETNRLYLAWVFRGGGYAVREAATGLDALRLAADQPDLIILDVHLPDVSGLEVCRRLKAEPATARIPVLHLSAAFVTSGDRATGLEAGADGYLVKPVDPQELLASVRALLRIRQAEAALRASEALLQGILDHAPVVVHVKDLAGRYLLVNRRWEKLFHISRAQAVGETVYDVFPGERADALRANDLRVIESRTPLKFEEVLPHDDGLHTYLSVKFPLYGDGGAVYAVGGISTDITDRKRAEGALRESEALYHSLVENLPLAILRKDCAGRFTFGNSRFCESLRRPLEQIVGKTDLDFYPEELARKYMSDDARVIDTGLVFADVEKHQRVDGELGHVEVLKSRLHDSRGQVIGVQAAFWDITERKQAEEQLARASAEFSAARRIQQKLFPTTAPRLAGLEIGGASFGFDIGGASYPAEAIGGDYYDYLPLPDGCLGIAIGDVSGHGLGPALLMAEVRAFLRAFAQTQADVGTILRFTNHVVTPDIDDDRFITLLLARLDPRTRSFSYASAGHQTGFILDPRGAVKRALESTSIPLGIFPDSTFSTSEAIQLETGDMVLFVTDGIVEARAPDGTAFGAQRTADIARIYRHLTAGQIVENLYFAVRAFSQNQPQYDDITATVVKVGPPAG
jgi:sigma-B regulation protein RsbU (phosphoserine phosphatase)